MSDRRRAYFQGVRFDEVWQQFVPTEDGKGGTHVWWDEAWQVWTPDWDKNKEARDAKTVD